MLQAFSTPTNRNRTFRILALGVVLLLAAMIVGISDNPVGIGLVFLAVIAFFLAFVRLWETPKQYLYLLCTSLLVLPVSVVVHNLLDAEVMLLFIFVLCPVGIIIGAIGALLCWMERL
jgi:hypothetical protein